MKKLLSLIVGLFLLSSPVYGSTVRERIDESTCRHNGGLFFTLKGNDFNVNVDQHGSRDSAPDAYVIYQVIATSSRACRSMQKFKNVLSKKLSYYDANKRMNLRQARKRLKKFNRLLNSSDVGLIWEINDAFREYEPQLYPHLREVRAASIMFYAN